MEEKQVRKWLIDRGMSQRALAEQLNYTEAYISQMLTGAEKLSPGFRGRFLTVFGDEEYKAVFGNGCKEEAAS